jgi:hypothetical protein
MMRSILRGTTVLLATSGLVVLGLGSASAATDDHHGRQQTVTVVGNGRWVHLSTDSIRAGSTRFRVSSTNPQNQGGGGSEITLFRLKQGKTLSAFFTGVREEFSQNPATAAKGTRDLVATVIVRGLADVVPGHAEAVTETLRPGTYYAMDLGNMPANGRPALTTLHVRHGDAQTDVASDFRVTTVDDRFSAPRVWPHRGTYTFVNEADTIHFALIVPIKPRHHGPRRPGLLRRGAQRQDRRPAAVRLGADRRERRGLPRLPPEAQLRPAGGPVRAALLRRR